MSRFVPWLLVALCFVLGVASRSIGDAFPVFVPALAGTCGAGSAFGSASSLAIDAFVCAFFFGTGTCVASFFRPAYVYVLP